MTTDGGGWTMVLVAIPGVQEVWYHFDAWTVRTAETADPTNPMSPSSQCSQAFHTVPGDDV